MFVCLHFRSSHTPFTLARRATSLATTLLHATDHSRRALRARIKETMKDDEEDERHPMPPSLESQESARLLLPQTETGSDTGHMPPNTPCMCCHHLHTGCALTQSMAVIAPFPASWDRACQWIDNAGVSYVQALEPKHARWLRLLILGACLAFTGTLRPRCARGRCAPNCG